MSLLNSLPLFLVSNLYYLMIVSIAILLLDSFVYLPKIKLSLLRSCAQSVTHLCSSHQSHTHHSNSPNHLRRKRLSNVVRNDCSINFHLIKLSTAKFSILYDASLVRDGKRTLTLITVGSKRI